MKQVVSPGCTTGPFFPVEFSDGSEDLTHRHGVTATGQHIFLTGRVLELGGTPARNMVIEIWQTDANGIFRHDLDPNSAQCDPGFWCWGRARTNSEGWYKIRSVIPGAYESRAPHINVAILGIGLTRRLVTTVFFADAPDPVFDCVKQHREMLIPKRDSALDAAGAEAYRFDVILRGEGQTPFFLD